MSWRKNLAYVPPAILLFALSIACRSAGGNATPTPTVPPDFSGTPGAAVPTAPPESTAPSVLFLIDQSRSMDEDFGGISRWQAVQQLFSAEEGGALAELAERARIGITVYSGEAGAGGCPLIAGASPGSGNREMLATLVGDTSPLSGSPTEEGILAATRTLVSYQGERWLVLITDGAADSCDDSDPAAAQTAAVGAAAAAYAQRVRVVPVALGSGAPADFITQIARAGSGMAVEEDGLPPAFAANNLGELRRALEDVAGLVGS